MESAIPVLPAAGQTREVVANRLKVVSRKDANGTLRTHVQGPSGPLPTVDVSPYHMNRGIPCILFLHHLDFLIAGHLLLSSLCPVTIFFHVARDLEDFFPTKFVQFINE